MEHHRTLRTAAAAAMGTCLAGLIGLLYVPTLKGLALEWASSPDSSYGLIVAAIAGGVAWSRRRPFLAAAAQCSGARSGLAVVGVGLLLYLVGSFGADLFTTRVSFVVVLTGVAWSVAGGRATRIFAAPLFFLLLAVPLPALVANAITLPLQFVASQMAEWMLGLARIPVFRDGNILELPSTSLEVAEACSGLRSLISLTAIACLVAWATERTIVRRVAVVASALPIAIALNAVRIAATGVACETWGRHMASGGWHTFTGWLTFIAAMGVLLQVQRALPHQPSRAEHLSTEAASA